ncbi:MAG TPA: Rho termination factor N-terminal domain-containing protein, partial [Ktedonobacterales bacterium]|nr:Rho termination factor N-terminal domain-containing protein [Ktedonobacterales bacterium]
MNIAELETKTLPELRDMARDWDLAGYTSLEREDLVFRLLQAETERQGNTFSGGVLE